MILRIKSTPGELRTRRWPRGSTILLGLSLLFAAGEGARAYDPPEIGPGLFSADGIFLAEQDRSSLLEALAAIGSNFNANERVDDDLREKSLAIALRLDPLHHSSRVAHRELARGATPPSIAVFDNLDSVSEILWAIGNRLAEPPLDPEERRLAEFLLELSLLTRSKPTVEQLQTFATVCDGQAPQWENIVKLQRGSNRSTERSLALFEESVAQHRQKRRKPAVAMPAVSAAAIPVNPNATVSTTPGSPAPPAAPPAIRPPRMTLPQIEPITASLATVRLVGVEQTPVGGTVSLTLRGPVNGPERALLLESANAATFPLIPSDGDLILNAFALPSTVLPGRRWAAGAVGEVRFTPEAEPPGARRPLRADAFLPALVLVESVLANQPVNADFVLLGEIDPTNRQVTLPGDTLSALAAAAGLGRPYIFLPATVGESLVAYLQKSNRLELLFEKELIAYTDADEALARLTAPTDAALISASAVFNEIREVSLRSDPATRVDLQDLAKIPSAQEKLRGILATFPSHLSAWAMLEYGTRPVTPDILLSQFATRIDQSVAPFLALEGDDEDFNALDAAIDRSDAQFLKLRAEIPIEARDLLGSAEDLVEAAQRYLELTNKTSSIAEQRLREVRTTIATFRAERTKLGLEAASSF
ncbi:MAG: hypothetical protein B9S36_00190 [Verrucomicrobiia bacterium Tous-C2TDCM]|nr:MAG: hypothetical protein B9S36_00190 [Verrucomicrobiae bacterium Tous-C2TDCM]